MHFTDFGRVAARLCQSSLRRAGRKDKMGGKTKAMPQNPIAGLLTPFHSANLDLSNRVVMAPMTRYFSPGGIPGPDVVAYYARRSEAGVSLIVTEGAFIPHPAAGFSETIPVLYGDEAMAAWRKVTDAVHAHNGKIAAQLWHIGSQFLPGGSEGHEAEHVSASGLAGPGAPIGKAMTLADILVVMNAGQVEQIGSPLDIYRKPATTFVASFIGAPPMNLLRVAANGLGGMLETLQIKVPGDAILGIRPEDFALAGTSTSEGLTLELTVDAIERVGAETYVYGTRPRENAGPAVSAKPGELPPGEIIVRLPGEAAPAIGERIRIVAASAKLHLFSPDGRSRIGG